MDAKILSQLAPTGTLRVALNMANGLLITGKAAHQNRYVVFAALGIRDVVKQERLAIFLVDTTAELPAHQRVHLGVLVDFAIYLDQKTFVTQLFDMLVQIRIAALFQGGFRHLIFPFTDPGPNRAPTGHEYWV